MHFSVLDPGTSDVWPELSEPQAALAIARLAQGEDRLIVALCSDSPSSQRLERALEFFLDKKLPLLSLPDWETLPYDQFAPHPDIVSRRVESLFKLGAHKRGVLVLPVATLLQRLAPTGFIRGRTLVLAEGETLDLEKKRAELEAAGYRHTAQVSEHGEYALRGSILDLYPMGAAMPFRIELFDDEIETIRSFDPETQRTEQRIEQIQLLPGREFPFDEEGIKGFRSRFRMRFDVDLTRARVYQDAKIGVPSPGIEYFLPLFFEHTDTLFDYLPDNARLIQFGPIEHASQSFLRTVAARYEQRRHDNERPILRPDELYLSTDELGNRLHGSIEAPDFASPAESEQQTPLLEQPEALRTLAANGKPVLIVADSAGRRERIADSLAKNGLRPEPVTSWREFRDQAPALAITTGLIEAGFALDDCLLLTDRELVGPRASRRRRSSRTRDPASIIRDLSDLRAGAPVVHEDYGVGRYRGLQYLDVGDAPGEFLVLEYADDDKLYIPVAQLGRVSRYTGTSEETAPLHRLGGDQWEKTKRKAAQKARDAAAELLDLYARREAKGGKAMPFDHEIYAKFAAQFPFEETPDQADAIEAVIGDLTAAKSMDRVVCGDVGFGKTEVALRAAFIAAQANLQVAVLVPTTLLAQQHHRNFSDRFADWPVRIGALSRFSSRKEQAETLADLEAGKIDIVIGTHRLLQKDIKFERLGLVIVDEEHRFGVRHKERLKALRAEVDMLTLTATPIPRTLNMAMSGLRDLSIIATPPPNRVAVKTLVSRWEDSLLHEAIDRELARGGQIYFLHNEVKTIDRIAAQVRDLAPQAEVRVAHGQMSERELEQIMLDFYRQRFHILVCTTIIESGIDVPSANTIIMHRADKLGLAQLHQLRGRVGRSHHRAFAYLIVPPIKGMTADAAKRIEALEALDELGSGFVLATHDLEIRGAGELLGEEQSGQIQQIGFSLYSELLERAINSLRNGEEPELDQPVHSETEIELHLPALIPDDYLPDVHLRLTLYKRIASVETMEDLRELQVEMIDRFGLLPEPVKNLFAVTELKLRTAGLGIKKLELGERGGRVLFDEEIGFDPASLIRLVQSQPQEFRFDGGSQLKWQRGFATESERIDAANRLLDGFAARAAA